MGADFSDVSLETERKRIEGQLADKDTRSWMIELDGQVIGNIEINSIQVASQEYGISAGKLSVIIGNKRYWGKRIAPFVEKKVMDWMFTEGGFELLVARVLPVNERSWHALERLRFDFQGIKADEQHPDEQWRMYTMTKDRWLEVREAVATSLHVA
jgi:RimJ/RimL family protein N-acetyltransferase